MSTTLTAIPESAADAINAEHRRCEACYINALEHAVNAGRMLATIKDELGHGRWLPWLTEHFEGTERTAQRYMLIAEHYPHANTTRVSDLSLRGALKAIEPEKPAMHSVRRALTDASTGERTEQGEQATDTLSSYQPQCQFITDLRTKADELVTEASQPELSARSCASALRDASHAYRRISAALENLAATIDRDNR